MNVEIQETKKYRQSVTVIPKSYELILKYQNHEYLLLNKLIL